ncbi:uroporphyrinogen-III synthase isoform X3 [Octopus bimaculoides]|uniref:uroporphyrinogen-III synthase isoform X3 n=1 Tax=Octopus bimaculoides TaxID=37653 RepID=UPI0022E9839F|nr:uroporphyrinogen-III synthase isoform X3 [Octopus bimaculoides]
MRKFYSANSAVRLMISHVFCGSLLEKVAHNCLGHSGVPRDSNRMSKDIKKNSVILFKSPAEGENDIFLAELQKSELTVNVVPVLSFQSLHTDVLAQKLSGDARNKYSGIIFTSTRSVVVVDSAIKQLTAYNKKTTCKDLKCFVVGKSTATSAANLGFKPTGENSGHGKKLAEFILKEIEKKSDCKPILFPCSKIRNDDLPTHLKQNGIPVEEITVYETLPNPHLHICIDGVCKALKGQPEYLVFFSPSGVDSALPFITPVWDMSQSKVLALGPSTEKQLKAKSIKISGVSKGPTPVDLVKLIKELS